MLEQNDEWAVTRRYMSLETVAQVCDDHTIDVARIDAGMISSGRCRRFDLFSDPAPDGQAVKIEHIL